LTLRGLLIALKDEHAFGSHIVNDFSDEAIGQCDGFFLCEMVNA
jgi:hypothetical protein